MEKGNKTNIKTTNNQKKEGDNVKFTLCPHCNTNLMISSDLLNENYLLCLKCNKEFANPYKPLNETKFKLKTWQIILLVFLGLYIFGKVIMKQNSNKTEVYEQTDRTEIYYNDKNGNVYKKEIIYKDGRPTEWVYYK